jgi:hypothetical protein
VSHLCLAPILQVNELFCWRFAVIFSCKCFITILVRFLEYVGQVSSVTFSGKIIDFPIKAMKTFSLFSKANSVFVSYPRNDTYFSVFFVCLFVF